MRVTLLDRETNLYYKGSGAWTVNPREAADFSRICRALDFAFTSGLPKLDLVLDFNSPRVNARLSATS